MEFVTRPCRLGDEQALSLVAQATILETYAGNTDSDDLITYANAELTVADFGRIWQAIAYAHRCYLVWPKKRSLRVNHKTSPVRRAK